MPKHKNGDRKGTMTVKQAGAKGGKKGGPARAKKLSDRQRTAIAKQGGKARQRSK